MIRKLGYYTLIIATIICIVRLNNKQQTLSNNLMHSPSITVSPTEPVNSPANSLTTANNISSTPSETSNSSAVDTTPTSENLPLEESCIQPADFKLLPETSLDELKTQGWHTPTKAEYVPDDYSEIKKYYKNSLEADFDNNGLKDIAIFMVKKNLESMEGIEQGIFVVLTQKQSPAKIFHMSGGGGLVYGGLILQKPGIIEAMDCSLDLQHPGIALSQYDSCGSEVIYWDKEQRKFLTLFTGC